MPRKPSHSRESLIEDAMHHFWHYGYAGSSMDDLVHSTGVSRHGIYSDVGGKRQLYLEGFTPYQDTVVTPTFTRVEAAGADMADIAGYFNARIILAEAIGLPGPGCHFANALTETAPHDPDVRARVSAHYDRLSAGFDNALSPKKYGLTQAERTALAEFLAGSDMALWSLSRIADSADILRVQAGTFINLVKLRLGA